MSDSRFFSSQEKDSIKISLYNDYKENQIKQLEDDYKEIKELNKKFKDDCQKFLLKPEKEFKTRFWDTPSDRDVLNVKYDFWALHQFFINHYSLQKSKDFFLKMSSHIESLERIGKHSSREYADSMEAVRIIVPELSELEEHIDLAYAAHSKETLKNLPFEFYAKLAKIEASTKPAQAYCRIS